MLLTPSLRRDSDRRSQLIADIEDLIHALDSSDSTPPPPPPPPPIYCEANDLLLLPPLCLDPTAEQVQQNTKILQNLMSKVESLEKLLSSSHAPSQASASPSYAKAASMKPANLTLFLELKSDIDELLESLQENQSISMMSFALEILQFFQTSSSYTDKACYGLGP